MRERHRFMKGLFGWVGLRQFSIPYERAPRLAGSSKFNSVEALELRARRHHQLLTPRRCAWRPISAAHGAARIRRTRWIVAKALLWGDPVAGWPTMMSVILFLGGVQLIALGLIGEYLGPPVHRIQAAAAVSRRRLVPATGVSSGAVPIQEGDDHAHSPPVARGESA
jgi:hypothetical protein